MKKRLVRRCSLLIVALFAIAMIFGMKMQAFAIPAPSDTGIEFPTTGSCGENLTYEYKYENEVGTITVTGKGVLVATEDFADCVYYSHAQNIVLDDQITELGDNALSFFNGETIKLPSSLKKIGNKAMESSKITSLELPAGVESIGEEAFCDCSWLKTITLNEGLKSIGQGAFRYCLVLSELNIPYSVTTIGDDELFTLYLPSKLKLPKHLIDTYIEKNEGKTEKDFFTKLFCDSDYESRVDIEYITQCPHACKKKVKDDRYLVSKATCTSPAKYYYVCDICSEVLPETYEIGEKLGHTEKTEIVPATVKADGAVVKKCATCGVELERTVIKKAIISVDEVAKYTGKAIKQKVTIKDSDGNAVSKNFYKIAYSNNKKVGKATVTVTFSGNYSGTVTKNFNIVKKEAFPKKVTGLKVTSGKKAFTVSWKKGSKNTKGYEIEYSTSKKFDDAKKIKIKKASTLTKTVKKLTSKASYYVRIRAYGKTGKITLYSDWVKIKKAVKVK